MPFPIFYALKVGFLVFEQIDRSYLVAPQPQQSLQHISSQFHDALRLDTLSQNSETKVCLLGIDLRVTELHLCLCSGFVCL